MIRATEAWDMPDVLALNKGVVVKTSPLDAMRLKDMLDWSTYSRVAEVNGKVVGFIIVMGPASGYGNANLDWFRERFERFLYVDRIIVDPSAAGKGIGRALYGDLADFASMLEIPQLMCEINVEPPNPRSARFHASLGFEEVGQRVTDSKTLSMQRLLLADRH